MGSNDNLLLICASLIIYLECILQYRSFWVILYTVLFYVMPYGLLFYIQIVASRFEVFSFIVVNVCCHDLFK